MKFMEKYYVILLFISVGCLLYACSGTGSLSSSPGTEVYKKDLSQVVKAVEKIIVSSNINLDKAKEEKNNVTIHISRHVYANNQRMQRDKGSVEITKVSEEKTRVEVNNPDYTFSVPRHQRMDYQKMIFSKLDKVLKKIS